MSGPDPAVEHSLPYTVKINVRPSLTGQTFYATTPMLLTMERQTTKYSKM